MTRKRFVKLVMSCGYGRNYANARADVSVKQCRSYWKAWEKSTDLWAVHACKVLANAIAPAFNRVWKQCKTMNEQIRQCFSGLYT